MGKRAFCVLLLLVTLAIHHLDAPAQVADTQSKEKPSIAGEGARPVSRGTVSLWLVKEFVGQDKQLPFLILLRGTEGWYQKKTTHSTNHDGTPIIMDWVVGETKIRVEYKPTEGLIRLFGTEFSLINANILLVDSVDEVPSVKSGGRVNLLMGKDVDPVKYVIERSALAREFVEGK